jgi:hypothetical protein
MRFLSPLLIGAALTACTTAPESPTRAAEAEAKLHELLAGKVAGEPQDCLTHWRTDDMVVIDDNTIAFESGGTVYRNELQGSCNQLGSGFYTLVTKSRGSVGLCRGEIAEVVDLDSGFTVGTCTIGDFVPYRPS